MTNLRHGARSESRVKAKARAHKRRILRRLGVRASDLDVTTLELLDLYTRGRAQLDLRDEGGHLDEKQYWVAFNATRRAAESFAARLRELGLDSGHNNRDPLATVAAAGRAALAARNGSETG